MDSVELERRMNDIERRLRVLESRDPDRGERFADVVRANRGREWAAALVRKVAGSERESAVYLDD